MYAVGLLREEKGVRMLYHRSVVKPLEITKQIIGFLLNVLVFPKIDLYFCFIFKDFESMLSCS